jgi:hypothetical protein
MRSGDFLIRILLIDIKGIKSIEQSQLEAMDVAADVICGKNAQLFITGVEDELHETIKSWFEKKAVLSSLQSGISFGVSG